MDNLLNTEMRKYKNTRQLISDDSPPCEDQLVLIRASETRCHKLWKP